MRLAWFLTGGLILGATSLGCGDDTSTGGGGSAGSTTEGGGGSGAGNVGGQNTGGQSTGGQNTGGAGGQGTGGEAPVCPPDVNDNACVACGKDSCCSEVTDCAGDPDCTPCLACISTAADPQTCLNNGCDGRVRQRQLQHGVLWRPIGLRDHPPRHGLHDVRKGGQQRRPARLLQRARDVRGGP